MLNSFVFSKLYPSNTIDCSDGKPFKASLLYLLKALLPRWKVDNDEQLEIVKTPLPLAKQLLSISMECSDANPDITKSFIRSILYPPSIKNMSEGRSKEIVIIKVYLAIQRKAIVGVQNYQWR